MVGPHEVELLYDGADIPGSTFISNVYDACKVRIVKSTSTGLVSKRCGLTCKFEQTTLHHKSCTDIFSFAEGHVDGRNVGVAGTYYISIVALCSRCRGSCYSNHPHCLQWTAARRAQALLPLRSMAPIPSLVLTLWNVEATSMR